MKSPERSAQPIAGNDVIETVPVNAGGGDSYQQFAGLMEVVEAFCHKWPERETFRDSDVFLL